MTLACSDREEDEDATAGLTAASGFTSADSTGTGTGTGTGGTSTTGGDEGPRLDMAVTTTMTSVSGGEDGGDKGCKGVDFLFVIDNSGSMADEQRNLLASFGGFVDAIEARLSEIGANDFHIMVVDTDGGRFDQPSGSCIVECFGGATECSDGTPCVIVTDPTCQATCAADPSASCDGGVPCSDLVECDGSGCSCQVGAGILDDQNGNACGVQGNSRYMVSGQPNLESTFSCLAEVGTDGSGGELQAQAVVQAVGQQANGPGGCNEAFVRNDAILVATLITDEEDSHDDPNGSSPGDPPGWKASMLAAKQGNEAGIVMLGLVGDTGTPGAICEPLQQIQGAEESPRLREFVSSFENHVLGSVCSPSYTSFFEQAVELIEDTCGGYEPPG